MQKKRVRWREKKGKRERGRLGKGVRKSERARERERERNLGEQRAAIYEKTKGPRPGSLKQKLADKGVCLCEQQQKGPWYVGIGEELSS